MHHKPHNPHMRINGKETKQAYLRLRKAMAMLQNADGIPGDLIGRMNHVYFNLEDMQPPERHPPTPHHVAEHIEVDSEKLISCWENINVVRHKLNHLKNEGYLKMSDVHIRDAIGDITRVFDILYELVKHKLPGHFSGEHH